MKEQVNNHHPSPCVEYDHLFSLVVGKYLIVNQIIQEKIRNMKVVFLCVCQKKCLQILGQVSSELQAVVFPRIVDKAHQAQHLGSTLLGGMVFTRPTRRDP